MKELKILAKRLLELRVSQKMTQRKVAGKLGITFQSYHAYEVGRAVPTIQNFIKLSDIFDVSLDYLIGRADI